MDEQRFDHLAKALSCGLSRRGVLRGAAAGLAGAFGLRASRVGAAQEKKPVCHYTGSASNPWQVIEVAEPAYLTHLGHGDQPFVDCCDDAACAGFNTCGGGGTPGACGCTPTFTVADCDGVSCGDFSNGCGETVACGCFGADTCGGGGGVDGQCGCTALTYDQACGAACDGTVADGCGGTHTCTCACPVVETGGDPACFWMDCGSTPGQCCWNLNGNFAGTQEACQALDSCEPGGGDGSGGGCYKWATSSHGPAIAPPWPVEVDPTLAVSVSALDGSPHACLVTVSVSDFPADAVLHPTFTDYWFIVADGTLQQVGAPWRSPYPIPLDASGSGSLAFTSPNSQVDSAGNYVVTKIVVDNLSWGPNHIAC